MSFSVPLSVNQSTTNLPDKGAATIQPGYNGQHYAAVIGLQSGTALCQQLVNTQADVLGPANLKLDAHGNLTSDALTITKPIEIEVTCANVTPTVAAKFTVPFSVAAQPVAAGDETDIAIINKVLAILTPPPAPGPNYRGPCDFKFNDCDWIYTVIGGVEQSDLSSQNSQTSGFVDLIVRAPWNLHFGSAWLQARFLGAPNASNTQGIVAAATNPSGVITAQSLETVGTAVDYVVGFQHDWFQASKKNPESGMFTLGAIVGFGATTPLSSQVPTVGFAVPPFGTQECTELHNRLGPKNIYTNSKNSPPLPEPGTFTTTTTVGSAAPVQSTASYCVVSPVPTNTSTTANGVTTTVTAPSTTITNIAFTPEDRSSFLLKYMAGVRLINRWHSGSTQRCSTRAPEDNADGILNGSCTRSIVDLTFGQDQAITGGQWRNFVFKSDSIFPIPKTGIYFFGTAAIRLKKNDTLPPLILTPTPISSTSAGSSVGSVTIPSPSVFVLPLKQSNRDFYRIGLGFDLSKILPKLFSAL